MNCQLAKPSVHIRFTASNSAIIAALSTCLSKFSSAIFSTFTEIFDNMFIFFGFYFCLRKMGIIWLSESDFMTVLRVASSLIRV